MLGRLLGRQGADSGKVAAEFREAIRLQPDYAEAHNNLGVVLVQAGDDPGAIAAFREAVRISPDYADAHANLGAALAPTDSEEAVRELEKAVALAPTLVKARFNLASAYGASPGHGRAKEIAELREVIKLAPTFARAHLALGKALLQEGKRERGDLRPPGGGAARARARRSSLPARPGPRAGGANRGGDPRAAEGPRAGGGERARPDREPRHRGGPLRAREGRPRPGGGQAPPRDPGPTRLIPGLELPRGSAREAGRRGRRLRRLPEGRWSSTPRTRPRERASSG